MSGKSEQMKLDSPDFRILCQKCGRLLAVVEVVAFEKGGTYSVPPCKGCTEALENRELKLCALEAAGVDNWSGYGNAQEILEQYRSGQ